METTDSTYPVRFDIDYPEEPRNRLTAAFRLILAIPILAVLAAIGAAGFSSGDDPTSFICTAAGVLFLPPLMLIVARQKYPTLVVRLQRRLPRVPQPCGRLPPAPQ